MAGEDMILMSLREVKRLKVVQSAIDKQTTQKRAGLMLGLSERQVRRLVRAVKEKGDVGIIHGSRGRPSHQRISAGGIRNSGDSIREFGGQYT